MLLCGPAGSGKSTFARRHFAETEVLSSDTLRGLLTDDPGDQTVNEETFGILHRIADVRSQRGLVTVIDATNLHAHARQPLKAIAKRRRIPTHLLLFDAPLDALLARNRARERRVDEAVVRQHHQDFQGLPRDDERWDAVDRVDTRHIDQVTVRREPLPMLRFHEEGPFDLVGDVHGCRVELEDLMAELGYAPDGSHPDGRRLVFVGDLVDRGPDSVGVLKLVLPWIEKGRALFVPGNHDDKLWRWLQGRSVRVSGGLATTVAEWQALSEPEERLLRRRFDRVMESAQPYLWLDGGRLLVSHAGLEERDHGRTGAAVRAFCLYGKTTGREIDGYPERLDWADDYEGAPAVVHGHVPVRTAQWRNDVADIDLGAVFGGELCAVRWPERTFVSVPARKAWWSAGRWGAVEGAEEPLENQG